MSGNVTLCWSCKLSHLIASNWQVSTVNNIFLKFDYILEVIKCHFTKSNDIVSTCLDTFLATLLLQILTTSLFEMLVLKSV